MLKPLATWNYQAPRRMAIACASRLTVGSVRSLDAAIYSSIRQAKPSNFAAGRVNMRALMGSAGLGDECPSS